MGRKHVFVLSLFVLLSSLLYVRFNPVEVKAADGYRVHNLDSGWNYTTVQEAINANETWNGHTIYVEAGTYYESVVVNKSLTLTGEDSSTTIIDGLSAGNVMSITVGNVNVTGFTIQNSSSRYGCCGLYVSSSGNNISRNIITNNEDGIHFEGGSYNSIYGNNITANDNDGIKLEGSSHNSIYGNNITNNRDGGIHLKFRSDNNSIHGNNIAHHDYGIRLRSDNNRIYGNNITANTEYGIYLEGANYNTIHGNVITKNAQDGIWFYDSHNNTIYGNNITDNKKGIRIGSLSSNNTSYHNNFIDNTHQLSIPPSGYANFWDDGYPSGGNYWDDYTGVDLYSGSNQSEAGSDGIGDTQYKKNDNNIDRYPLMGPIRTFTAGTWQEKTRYVDVISNSTVSSFKVDETAKTISLNVKGTEGAAGFCRITIPNIIVQDFWQEGYTVLLNGEPWPFRNWTDNTNTYVYINYTHSEHEITIIPEFPSLIILPLFMIATLLAVIVYGRKHST